LDKERNELRLIFPLKPLSVNAAYKNVPKKGRVKTGEYKRFATDLNKYLEEYNSYRDDFVSYFKSKSKYLYLETVLTVFVPREFFLKAEGGLSTRKGDCGNYRKVIHDIITKWLGIDDKYSVDERNIQFPTEYTEWEIVFTMHAKDLRHLDNHEKI